MIDLERAKTEFEKYVSNYDNNNGKVKLKKKHTFEVIKLSEYIASDLQLSDEDISLAKFIALLHDIGRFEQTTQFDDFRDYNTFDHADFGVELLFEDGFIREFVEDDLYDDIIKKAVVNHNKYAIKPGLSGKELLHSQIIRDADKTDSFRVKNSEDFSDLAIAKKDAIENDDISDHIYNDFMRHKQIVTEERVTEMDNWVSYIAFIFDYNFDSGLKYIQQHDYINKLVDRIDYKNPDTRKKMEEIRKCALEYVESRIASGTAR